MANAIKTQSLKKVVTAKKVAPKKKAVKKSESVILKTQINNNWKDATRSLSALVKYVNNDGKTDIQKMLDNKEIGAALLRIIEVIGPEKIEDIDDDTVYFIINTLNQLNADLIRNKLLLKVLPLKV